MADSGGVSGSRTALQTLSDQIRTQATQAGKVTTDMGTAGTGSAGNPTGPWYPQFGEFTEAQDLYKAFYDTCLQLYASTGILHNALGDLHDGTVTIQKNYSDTNNTLDYVAGQLKGYDDYLGKFVHGTGAGG